MEADMRDRFCTGLILAAGFSTRMKRFKPLLPLGSFASVLARVVALWRSAGVEEVLVVSGHRACEVEAEALRLGCTVVRNPHPEDGMFSSVLTGLRFLNEAPPLWTGVLPVDIPLIAPQTIRTLLAEAARFGDLETGTGTEAADCLLPECAGKTGHPPLLHRRALPRILACRGEGGLRGAMEGLVSVRVPVEDGFLNADLDTPADYEKALGLVGGTGDPLICGQIGPEASRTGQD